MPSSSIVRSDDLRDGNRRRVLGTLRANGPCSPAQLAEHTRLSAASISSLTSQLAEQNVVTSSRQKSDNVSRGRPQSQIKLNASAGDIVTLNLAIDLVQVQRINYAGVALHNTALHTPLGSMSESTLVEFICKAVKKVMALDIGHPVQRIGVAFQGVTENATGALSWSPIIKHHNLKLGHILQSTFDIPVSVNNDCRLISEALSNSSADILGHSFATLLFSYGVGLGLYIEGKPFSGIRTSGLELGHLRFERNGSLCRCGRHGCIEAYAADYGILRLASGESIHETPAGRVEAAQIQELCKAGLAGNNPAEQAFAIAGAAIGDGLSTLFTLLDPMPVALVGRSVEGFELMRKGVKSVFAENNQGDVNIDDLLHCFDDAQPLLEDGLTSNTLSLLDTQFAYQTQSADALRSTS
ncbi:MAG: ROK family protein [Granulosicoccus sp.]